MSLVAEQHSMRNPRGVFHPYDLLSCSRQAQF